MTSLVLGPPLPGCNLEFQDYRKDQATLKGVDCPCTMLGLYYRTYSIWLLNGLLCCIVIPYSDYIVMWYTAAVVNSAMGP